MSMASASGANGEAVSFLKAVEDFEDIDADGEVEEKKNEVRELPRIARVEARPTDAQPARDDERALISAETADDEEPQPLLRSQPSTSPSSGGAGGRCGFWRFKCAAIQRLNQFELFLVLLTLDGLVVGMQGALKSALLTKLERRFALDSTTSSLIMSANDMVFLPSVLLVSYFGSLGHRPRLLALSCCGYGFSALLFAMPYFLFGPMPVPVDDPSLANQQLGYACPQSGNDTASQLTFADDLLGGSVKVQTQVALALFLIAGFIEGLASAPFFNLGVAFIADITGDFSGVFVGLVIAARLLSPTLAYQLYGKVLVRLSETLAPSEPRQRSSPFYIPAWWLGFCGVGVAAILISLPMALFPKKPHFNGDKYRALAAAPASGDQPDGKRPGLLYRLVQRVNRKRAAAVQARRLGRGRAASVATSTEKAAGNLHGFLTAIKRLLSNPVYVFLLLGNMFEFMEINCIIAYMPKYLEMHFRIGSGEASMLTGIAGPGANVIGIIISSVVASQVDWRVPQLAKYHACVNLFGILAAMIGFFFSCPPVQFYGGLPQNSTFLADCMAGAAPARMSPFNSGCSCNSSTFKPLCIEDVNFYNPCAANCFLNRGNVSCSCAMNGTGSPPATDSFPMASLRDRAGQLCSDECSSTAYIFLTIFVLIKLVRLSARSQEAVLQMRCVRPKDKALGLGINSFTFSIGGIWVPTFMGFLFSQACMIQQVSESGTSCLFYNTEKFRYSFVGFTTAALIPACTFFFLAWYYTEKDPKYTDMSSRRGTVELPMSDRPDKANGDVEI